MLKILILPLYLYKMKDLTPNFVFLVENFLTTIKFSPNFLTAQNLAREDICPPTVSSPPAMTPLLLHPAFCQFIDMIWFLPVCFSNLHNKAVVRSQNDAFLILYRPSQLLVLAFCFLCALHRLSQVVKKYCVMPRLHEEAYMKQT